LNYFFLFCIITYVALRIVYFQAYLNMHVPVGYLRLSLEEPSTRISASSLPYCKQFSARDKDGSTNYNCTFWDEHFTVFPVVEDHNMLVTTRVSITEQVLPGCHLSDYRCRYITTNDTNTYYIADVEHFTLQIDHGFYTGHKQNSVRQMKGQLFGQDSKPIHNSNGTVFGVIGEFDLLPLQDLLMAAGLSSLDNPSYVVNETLRYSGLVLILFVDYSNTFTYNLSRYQYTARVEALSDAEFKVNQPIYTKTIENGRVLWNRHGIRIIVQQGGQIGQFDFMILFNNVVQGLALSTMATKVLDILATTILPQKKIVAAYKYTDVDLMPDLSTAAYKKLERLESP